VREGAGGQGHGPARRAVREVPRSLVHDVDLVGADRAVNAGLLLLPHDPPARLVEIARLAESAGYDHLWLADERFHREVYGSLALVAHHTSRITVGTCVTDPYSRHPA